MGAGLPGVLKEVVEGLNMRFEFFEQRAITKGPVAIYGGAILALGAWNRKGVRRPGWRRRRALLDESRNLWIGTHSRFVATGAIFKESA